MIDITQEDSQINEQTVESESNESMTDDDEEVEDNQDNCDQ